LTARRDKALGKYYTPRELAQKLANWTIVEPETKFLDPSFGGCSFLYAAIERLQDLGTQKPGRFVYGVDLDPTARNYLPPLVMAGARPSQFLTTDFLGISAGNMPGAPFQAICGNPPFVRHHLIPPRRLQTAISAIRNADCEIPRVSSYWAYFLIHSLHFLEKGGRLAMILPTSFLYSNYSRRIRAHLKEKFSSVTIILLHGLVFDGAEEVPVLVLANRYLCSHRSMKMAVASSMKLIYGLSCKSAQFSKFGLEFGFEKEWALSLVRPRVLKLYKEVASDDRVSKLAEWADTKIGVVTGCNDFFALSETDRRRFSLPLKFLRPAVTRGQHIKGLQFTQRDYRDMIRVNKPSYLLYAPAGSHLPRNVLRYIQLGKKKGVDQRYKCSLREKWFSLDDRLECDAFLNYMTSSVPHLVLNTARVTCTNAIHRLRFSRQTEAEFAQCLAVACICSLTQLSIEMVGRSYGGGVLKLEPSEAREILLAVPPPSARASAMFRRIDSELRRGNKEIAVGLADKFVLKDFLQLETSDIRDMHNSWRTLVKHRFERAKAHPAS